MSLDSSTRPSALPPELRRFWIAMAVLTALSAVYTAVTAYLGKLHAPYGLPLLWYDGIGGDFNVFGPGFRHFGRPDFWQSFDYPFTYPAPLGVVFAVLYRSAHPLRWYESLLCLAAGMGAWLFVRELARRGVAPAMAWAFALTTLAMTWPLLFEFDTANSEGIVVIVLATGLTAILKDRWWLGCALVGVAGAMKIFPLVLLALALSRRRYKEFVFGIVVASVAMLASLAYLGPSIVEAQRNIDAGLALVQDRYFFSMLRVAPAFDHSLWMPVRFAAVSLDRILHPMPAAQRAARTLQVLRIGLHGYLLVCACGGVALYLLRIRRLPMLNQILALTVCALLLPPLSLEYTLLHLLLPFALLATYAVEMERRGDRAKGLAACLACFVVLFNADSFLNHRYVFASEARLLALAVLLFLVLRYRFQPPAPEASS